MEPRRDQDDERCVECGEVKPRHEFVAYEYYGVWVCKECEGDD